MIFVDRKDAGKKLCESLEKYENEDVIVLAVPRGGLEVAYDTIKGFHFEWDLIIPRKIGAPHNKEIAIGAVSSDGSYILDDYYVNMLGVSQDYIEQETSEQVKEIHRRMEAYRGRDTFPEVAQKTVIIIDDGIATGYTILAALKAVKKQGAAKTVLAIPIGPKDAIEKLKPFVDEIICLHTLDMFYGVGAYYTNFEQVGDEEVFRIINELRR